MRKITPELTSELYKHFTDPNKVASGKPFKVSTFRELVEHTARLSYRNKDHMLFYRGQSGDYKNKAGSSTFYPTIYRGDYLPIRELENRFDILEGASKALVNLFEERKIDGYRDLKKRKSIQWSILQHYEVCATPFIDFTHSLRVACSFAMMDNESPTALVYAFGMPYLTNRISVNSEHDIINVRLLSICPPNALRPYFQEGYLIGTEDITTNYDSKSELDFNNRLVAKFEIPNNPSFWGEGFHKIPKKSLYPDNDPIKLLCDEIKQFAEKELKAGDMGEFLQAWAELEELLIRHSKLVNLKNNTVLEAMRELSKTNIISLSELYALNNVRTFRNALIHKPKHIKPKDVPYFLDSIRAILADLKDRL
jgi:uncharacterized protein YutE (UPF0331/DUF86 family)